MNTSLRDLASRTALVLRDSGRAQVIVQGFAGPPSPAGPGGITQEQADARYVQIGAVGVVVPFAFGDASPVTVYVPGAGRTNILARLVIDTPFDGVGAALALGTSGSADSLLAAAHNDPTAAAGYEAAPDVALTSGEPVVLTITPGAGATQGSGRIIFDTL